MKRHLLWFAFSLSLLFNVFFAAGYAKARAEARDDTPQAVAMVTQELKLDDRQAKAFASLRAVRDDDSAIRSGIALAQQELMAELDRENPDPERVRAIVARQSELMEQQRLSGFDRMCEFVGMLSPDQRHRMFKHLRRRGPFSEKRQKMLLERFDSDGNGTLDETEKAEAKKAIEAHHAERRNRFEEARKRFDANGDGELDAEEQSALEAWRRERRRGHRDR